MYSQPQTASELRYTLSVLEERTHLGLDSESANRIREVLERRIAEAERASAERGASPVAVAVEEPELVA